MALAIGGVCYLKNLKTKVKSYRERSEQSYSKAQASGPTAEGGPTESASERS